MRVIRLEEVDSTNNFLKEMGNKKNYDCVIASMQTSGKGRRGNTWVSQNGMALFSFLVAESDIEEEDYLKIPLISGIAVLRGLKKIEAFDYKFKWTNDIYLDGKKLCGILVEKISGWFVIGIGINVNNLANTGSSEKLKYSSDTGSSEEFGNLENIAISLRGKSGKFYNIEDIILTIVNEFKNIVKNDSWENVLEDINSNNFLYNREIEIVKYGENIGTGVAKNIAYDGSLEVEIEDEIRNYVIGEIHIKK